MKVYFYRKLDLEDMLMAEAELKANSTRSSRFGLSFDVIHRYAVVRSSIKKIILLSAQMKKCLISQKLDSIAIPGGLRETMNVNVYWLTQQRNLRS